MAVRRSQVKRAGYTGEVNFDRPGRSPNECRSANGLTSQAVVRMIRGCFLPWTIATTESRAQSQSCRYADARSSSQRS